MVKSKGEHPRYSFLATFDFRVTLHREKDKEKEKETEKDDDKDTPTPEELEKAKEQMDWRKEYITKVRMGNWWKGRPTTYLAPVSPPPPPTTTFAFPLNR